MYNSSILLVVAPAFQAKNGGLYCTYDMKVHGGTMVFQSHLILSPTPLKYGIDVGIGAGPVWCLSGLRSVEPVVNRMYTCCFRRSSSLVGFQTFVGR